MNLKSYLCKKHCVDSAEELFNLYKNKKHKFENFGNFETPSEAISDFLNSVNSNCLEFYSREYFDEKYKIIDDAIEKLIIPKNILNGSFSEFIEYVKEKIIDKYRSLSYNKVIKHCVVDLKFYDHFFREENIFDYIYEEYVMELYDFLKEKNYQ